MTITKVVNLRKEDFDIYIGRKNRFVDPNYGTGRGPSNEPGLDGYFGNPFNLKPKATQTERDECIMKYRMYFEDRIKDLEFKKRIEELRGKRLGCFCHPKTCHGDVIVEYLEGKP